MKKLIILDRDGVINYDSPDYIKSPDEWQPIPGSIEAIALLKNAGYIVVVATNQSGIARNLYDIATLQSIHEKMQQLCLKNGAAIDKIYYCPHHPSEHCACRKPKPGMLVQIAQDFDCSLNNVPVIGDRLTDIAAAQAVHAFPIFVATSYLPLTEEIKDKLQEIPQFENLLQAVQALLNHDLT